TTRSLSAALNTLRWRFGTVSNVARLFSDARCGCSLSGKPSASDLRNGFGTLVGPFSAHRYLHFQGELSQTTLAQGVRTRSTSFQPPPGPPPLLSTTTRDQLQQDPSYKALGRSATSGPRS